MPPSNRAKKMHHATAVCIARSHILHQEGRSYAEIGKALGKSAGTVKGYYLQDRHLGSQLAALYRMGPEMFANNFQKVVDDEFFDDDPELDEAQGAVESITYPGFTFLKGEQAAAWFRAIEAGADVWVAADAAEIDRKLPVEWLAKAREGSEEHANWATASRRFSAMAFLKLRERLADAPASWRGIAEAAATFSHFDASEEGRNPVEEVREMLQQVLAESGAGGV